MSEKSKVAEYLRRAAEAENLAAVGPDAWARDQWIKIALDYRELAQAIASQQAPKATSEQPAQQAASQAASPTAVIFTTVKVNQEGDQDAGWTIERQEPGTESIRIGRVYSTQQAADEEAERLNHEAGAGAL